MTIIFGNSKDKQRLGKKERTQEKQNSENNIKVKENYDTLENVAQLSEKKKKEEISNS